MKKIFASLISLFLFVTVSSCTMSQTKTIEISGEIKSEFDIGEALQFEVIVGDGTNEYNVVLKLTNDGKLVYVSNPHGITGITATGFDTRTSGEKTLKVQYGKAFVTAVYRVRGTGDEPIVGIGTEEDPYLVATVKHLQEVGTKADVYYKLVNDIDLEGVVWVAKELDGVTIDGNNKTISNLYINNTLKTDEKTALFASAKGNVTIKNLYLDNFDLIGNEYNAGLVAFTPSGSLLIENVHINRLTINAIHYVGGFVGQAKGKLEVKNSTVNLANLTANFNGDDGDKVGGVVGQTQSDLVVENISVTNLNAWGVRDVGGIAGYAMATSTEIQNVVLTGTVFASHREDAVNSGGLPAEPGAGKLIGSLGGISVTVPDNEDPKEYVDDATEFDFTPYIFEYDVDGLTALSTKLEWGNNFLVGSFRYNSNYYAPVNQNLHTSVG